MILSSWSRRLPGWVEMLRETRVLSRRRMQELFPDARFYVERLFGIEKSYSAYRAVSESGLQNPGTQLHPSEAGPAGDHGDSTGSGAWTRPIR
jgi:hypothetical protein